MTHKLRLDDFRARRSVLDPDDFALGDDAPDPPPSNLVDKSVWNAIVTLPDDVSIRTSDHHGGALTTQHGLWGSWIHTVAVEVFWEKPMDPAARAILDVGDELNAATFEMLTGYYRQAASSLRAALEIMLAGSHASVTRTSPTEFSYRTFSRELGASPAAAALDSRLRQQCERCVFAAARFDPWVGDLYGRLTDYAHTREGHSLGDIRQSNGPIYVPRAVIAIHALFVETFMIVAVLARLVRPDFKLADDSRKHLIASGVTPTKVAAYAFVELFPTLFEDPGVFLAERS
jgi:hypothetical protein